jgi:hypothetical protein
MNNKIATMSEDISVNPSQLNGAKTWEDFISLWMVSKEIDIKNQWWKGDIVNKISVVYGENSLDKFAEEVKESTVTLENYRRVSRAFDETYRNQDLSWTHYLVASYADSYNKGENKFESNERYNWIDKANNEGWSTNRLGQEIKNKETIRIADGDMLAPYETYLTKVKYIFTHIDKKTLSKEQMSKLLNLSKNNFDYIISYLENNFKSEIIEEGEVVN